MCSLSMNTKANFIHYFLLLYLTYAVEKSAAQMRDMEISLHDYHTAPKAHVDPKTHQRWVGSLDQGVLQ